jgi:opacity protein-like surface antigen
MANWTDLSNWTGVANWLAFGVAASLSFASVGAARAVDLPPAPALPAVSAASEPFAGWYLRGDIGAGFETKPDIGAVAVSVTPGASLSPTAVFPFRESTLSTSGTIDAGVGYVFTPWARMDGALEYRFGGRLQSEFAIPAFAPLGVADPFGSTDRLRAGVSSIVALMNGYVDLGSYWGATPFVGAGIGVADNALSGVSDQGFALTSAGAAYPVGGFFSNASRTQFAWALMAGLDFDIAPNIKVELSYRYLNLGSMAIGGVHCVFGAEPCAGGAVAPTSRGALASNDVRIGIIWLVGDPASAPAPVVARY